MMGFNNTWIIGGNETKSELEIKNDMINNLIAGQAALMTMKQYEFKIDQLQSQLALAREGLEFYGANNSSDIIMSDITQTEIKDDMGFYLYYGKKAREILAQLDKKENNNE